MSFIVHSLVTNIGYHRGDAKSNGTCWQHGQQVPKVALFSLSVQCLWFRIVFAEGVNGNREHALNL